MLKHWTAWPRAFRWLADGLVAIVLVFVVAWVLFVPIADWLAHHDVGSVKGSLHETAVDDARARLLTLGAGVFVAGALAFTARTYYLSRRGQFTDRYANAIAQLASDKLTERLGGIYALEHLMRESAADHSTVVAVLAAFIRERAPTDTDRADQFSLAAQEPESRPGTDVQAALTVLARRPDRPEPYYFVDLSRTDLRGADLREARLVRADLEQAWLNYANLSSANLKQAMLRGTQFRHAWLVDTNLEDADLIEAQLEQANLGGAQLLNAVLLKANLRKAHLRSANLESARLAGACLEDAYLVDARLRNAQLAGEEMSRRGSMKSIGYHPEEEEQDEDLGGANLKGANLAGAQGLTAVQLAQAVYDESTVLPDLLSPSSPENPASPG